MNADDESALRYWKVRSDAFVPLNEALNGVLLSVSLILILTKSVPTATEAVWLEVMSVNDTTVGAAFSVTFILILPDPILSYWSLKVIVELTVSPDPVPEPLICRLSDIAPAFVIATWAFDEVNDWTAAVP